MNSAVESTMSFFRLLVIILFSLNTRVYAQHQEPMSTDRPGFTDTTKTVQEGKLQIESGYLYTYDDDTDLRDHSFGITSFRLGIADLAELRFGLNLYQETTEGLVNSYGVGDLTVGTKLRLIEDCDCNFELSTILDLTLPTGSSDLSQDDVSPRGILVWAYDWDTDFSLGGNINFNVPVNDGDYFFEPSASLTLGYSIDEKWGTFFEYLGGIQTGGNAPSSAPRNFLNGGFTYLLTDDIQFDLTAGFGVNDSAEDFFTGCGIAFRI